MTIHEEKRHANIRVSRKNQVRFEMFNNHVDGEDELMTKTESQKRGKMRHPRSRITINLSRVVEVGEG